jgi:type IV secretion system protein VirB8
VRAMNERSVRIAWRVAIGACALTAMAVAALMMLLPLKRVDPFVIRVDNTTGIVDVVPAFAGNTEMSETVTRYFPRPLRDGLRALQLLYRRERLRGMRELSHPGPKRCLGMRYGIGVTPYRRSNLYKDGSSIRAQVSAITFFRRGNGGEDLAQVRFTKTRRIGGTGSDQVSHWIATVQYVYGEPPKDPQVRRWNPLGFKIVDYRAEAELMAAPEPSDASPKPGATPQLPAGGTP